MSAELSAVLRSLGLDTPTADYLTAVPGSADLVPGRVVRVDKGLSTVLTEDGPVRATRSGGVLAAIATDAQATPCTGDWVALRHWPDDRITVEAVAPRSTAIVRAEVGGTSRGQVLAANVDVIAIVVGLHPEPNIGRIERFLALAWESGASPLIVLTKADLVGDPVVLAHLVEDVETTAPGVQVLAVSAETGEGTEVLAAVVSDGTSVLLGVSGAGKSTLANVLLGGEASQIAHVRVQQLRDIQTMNDPIAARAALQAMGIQWLITVGQNQLAFDPDAAQSNFRSQDVSVYHVVSTDTNKADVRGESK